MGWIGAKPELMNALRVINADKDDEGDFLIGSGKVVSFLGAGEEFVVDDDAVYFVEGRQCALAGLLNSTSYGVGVTVI